MMFSRLVGESNAKNLCISYKDEYRVDYKWVRDEDVFGLALCKSYLQRNIRTNESFLCIQETFYDSSSDKIVDMLEELLLLNGCQYFNQFKAFAYEELPDQAVRIFILIEYFEMNLAKLMKKKQPVDRSLVNTIITAYLSSIIYLSKQGEAMLAISFSNTQLKMLQMNGNDPYIVKILHFPFMQSSFDMVYSNKLSHYNCFLSPDELAILSQNQGIEEYDQINLTSASLFSFGALLLDLLNIANPDTQAKIYDRNTFSIDQESFLLKVHFVAEKYPKRIVLLLEQLLKFKDRLKARVILAQFENGLDASMSRSRDNNNTEQEQEVRGHSSRNIVSSRQSHQQKGNQNQANNRISQLEEIQQQQQQEQYQQHGTITSSLQQRLSNNKNNNVMIGNQNTNQFDPNDQYQHTNQNSQFNNYPPQSQFLPHSQADTTNSNPLQAFLTPSYSALNPAQSNYQQQQLPIQQETNEINYNSYNNNHNNNNSLESSSLSQQLKLIEQVQQLDDLPAFDSHSTNNNNNMKGSLKPIKGDNFDSFYGNNQNEQISVDHSNEVDFIVKKSNSSPPRESVKKQRTKWDIPQSGNSPTKIPTNQSIQSNGNRPSGDVTDENTSSRQRINYYLKFNDPPVTAAAQAGAEGVRNKSLSPKLSLQPNTNTKGSNSSRNSNSHNNINHHPPVGGTLDSLIQKNINDPLYSKYLFDSQKPPSIQPKSKPFLIEGSRHSMKDSSTLVQQPINQSRNIPSATAIIPPPPPLNSIGLGSIPPAPQLNLPLGNATIPSTNKNTAAPQSNIPQSSIPPPPPSLNLFGETNSAQKKQLVSNNIPPAPPLFNNNNIPNSSNSNIPPAPKFNLLVGDIPAAPPLNLQSGGGGQIPAAPGQTHPVSSIPASSSSNQQSQNSLSDPDKEEEQSRKKKEILARIFSNNQTAAPVKLLLPSGSQPTNNNGKKQQEQQQQPIQQQQQPTSQPEEPSKNLFIPPAPVLPMFQVGQSAQQALIPPPPPNLHLFNTPTSTGGNRTNQTNSIPSNNIAANILSQPSPPPPPLALQPSQQYSINYVVKPKLEAEQTARDELKEMIEQRSSQQKNLQKQSKDILSISQSSLDQSTRLLERLKQKKIDEENLLNASRQLKATPPNDALSTFRELRNQQEQYLSQSLARSIKTQEAIKQDQENTLQMIQSHHSLLLSANKSQNHPSFIDTIKEQENQEDSQIFTSFNPTNTNKQSSIINNNTSNHNNNLQQQIGSSRSYNNTSQHNLNSQSDYGENDSKSYKFPANLVTIAHSYCEGDSSTQQTPDSPGQNILRTASKFPSPMPFSDSPQIHHEQNDQVQFSKDDPFLLSHHSSSQEQGKQQQQQLHLSEFQDFRFSSQRQGEYPMIPERSANSEAEPEEQNSLIMNSPIQDLVNEQITVQERNKSFYQELRKRKPQHSNHYFATEFDSQNMDDAERHSLKSSQQQQAAPPQLDQIVQDSTPVKYPVTSDFKSSERRALDHYDDEDDKHEIGGKILFSEFDQFSSKDSLLNQLIDQLKLFPEAKKIHYKNALYEGQVSKTDRLVLKHGFGIYHMKNGDIYCGYFRNNEMEGEGAYFYHHGDVYRGQLVKSLRQGQGTYFYQSQGIIYQGDWVGNVKEGFGRLLMTNGDKYEGYFKQNLKCGRGQFSFANGDVFDGEWVFDRKCGKGKLEFKDGTFFEGNFYDDLPYGQGTMEFTNGDQFHGNYEDGCIAGYGVYIHANEQYYKGDFSQNQMNGEGIYYFNNGDKYQGQYVEGLRDGFGKYVYSNGCVYEGQWKKNQKHGTGKFTFPDGTYYQGNFDESIKAGFGKQTFKGNEFYSGQWKNDSRNGHGYYQFSDESYYEGEWLNDKMHGEGTYYLKNSTGYQKIYGFWNDDELFHSTF